MSLYELESMMRSFAKLEKEKAPLMTTAEMEASKDAWRSMNLPDVRI